MIDFRRRYHWHYRTMLTEGGSWLQFFQSPRISANILRNCLLGYWGYLYMLVSAVANNEIFHLKTFIHIYKILEYEIM